MLKTAIAAYIGAGGSRCDKEEAFTKMTRAAPRESKSAAELAAEKAATDEAEQAKAERKAKREVERSRRSDEALQALGRRKRHVFSMSDNDNLDERAHVLHRAGSRSGRQR